MVLGVRLERAKIAPVIAFAASGIEPNQPAPRRRRCGSKRGGFNRIGAQHGLAAAIGEDLTPELRSSTATIATNDRLEKVASSISPVIIACSRAMPSSIER